MLRRRDKSTGGTHPMVLALAVGWGGLTAAAPFTPVTRLPWALPTLALGAMLIVALLFLRVARLSMFRTSAFDGRLSAERRG